MSAATRLFFTSPKEVKLRTIHLPPPREQEVLVQTLYSAISPGTEMLVYRGEFPRQMTVDSCFAGMDREFGYPISYGYACVGRVISLGSAADPSWLNRLVFAFQPHGSHFLAQPDTLLPLPEDILPEQACFLPNMETAVNLVQDGAPLLGERVLVLGQGIIGLLVAALLREFPLETLVTSDFIPLRCQASQALGITACLDARSPALDAALETQLHGQADLTFELSGSPLALDTAIHHTTFSGRVVIGSWYGEKRAALDLGGNFHRSRIKLIASQVSTISPELSARWDKLRRFETTWQALRRIAPQKWLTHRFPIERAAEAYQLLDSSSQEAIQVIFEYNPS